MGVAHPSLVREYEQATANVLPPNDPILLPGQLHRPSHSNSNGVRNANGNGVSVPGTSGGFGVSAERSGCLSDSPYGGGGGGGVAGGLTAQHFKWLSSESSEYTWMTWF